MVVVAGECEFVHFFEWLKRRRFNVSSATLFVAMRCSVCRRDCLFPDYHAAAGLVGGQDEHFGYLYVGRSLGGVEG